MWWMVARDRQSCKKGLLGTESHCGLYRATDDDDDYNNNNIKTS
jgi:hypothetical protein